VTVMAGVRALLRREWGARPPWARWVLAGYLIGFTDGFGAHLLVLGRYGIHAYSSFPQAPLRIFFVSLVVLDPLVAVLVAVVRPAGIVLAGAVMAADVAANLTGNWPGIQRDPAGLLLSANLLAIGLFGLFVLVTVIPLLRVADARRSGS
jgi:hypothetical protein